MPKAFRINPADNVATLLEDAPAGSSVEVSGISGARLSATSSIALGHKIAVTDIAKGSEVIKFGVQIGHATQPIQAGDWIHLHNCASNFDERSKTLDVHSGAVNDTRYE